MLEDDMKSSYESNKPDFGDEMSLAAVWIAWCECALNHVCHIQCASDEIAQ